MEGLKQWNNQLELNLQPPSNLGGLVVRQSHQVGRPRRGETACSEAERKQRRIEWLKQKKSDPVWRAKNIQRSREYYRKNRIKILSRWAEKNNRRTFCLEKPEEKQQRLLNAKEARARNEAAKKRAKWAALTPEQKAAIYKARRELYGDAIKEGARKYRLRNLDKLRKQGVIKERERRKRDPQYRALHSLRHRLYIIVKRGHGVMVGRHEYTGCTREFLVQHLERQFKPGMSWDNYGTRGWHIDHIIPCDSFDLTDQEQVKRCFHWTNLQPLWWIDNLKKSNKWTHSKAA